MNPHVKQIVELLFPLLEEILGGRTLAKPERRTEEDILLRIYGYPRSTVMFCELWGHSDSIPLSVVDMYITFFKMI